MSVEFAVDLSGPVGLPALVSTAEAVLAELLGLADTPGLVVLIDGHPHRPPQTSAEPTQIGTTLGPDTWAIVDESGDTLVHALVTPFSHDFRLTLEPRRDARGIVTALSLAMAAAIMGNTAVIDTDVGLIDPRTTPAEFVHRWRLTQERVPIGVASLRFLRQFDATRDWPSH